MSTTNPTRFHKFLNTQFEDCYEKIYGPVNPNDTNKQELSTLFKDFCKVKEPGIDQRIERILQNALYTLDIQSDQYGFRPAESSNGAYLFSLNGLFATALDSPLDTQRKFIRSQDFHYIYSGAFPFHGSRDKRSDEKYLGFEEVLVGVVNGVAECYVTGVLESIAGERGGKLALFEFFVWKVSKILNS